MASHRRKPITVDLDQRGAWDVFEFAAWLGRSDAYIYKRTIWDDTNTTGIVTLPGGIRVPVHRDINGHAVIYRRQYDAAVDAAPTVEVPHWDGHST